MLYIDRLCKKTKQKNIKIIIENNNNIIEIKCR